MVQVTLFFLIVMAMSTGVAAILPQINSNAAFGSTGADDNFVSFTETKDARINFEMLGPIKFDMPNQVFPYIANGTDYTINVTFFRPDVMAPMKDVKYNILVLNEIAEEIFNAASQNGTDALYSTDGKATMRYNFAETGGAGVRVVFLGEGSQTVEPQNADFEFQVVDSREIPEFGPVAALLMTVGIVGSIVLAGRLHDKRKR